MELPARDWIIALLIAIALHAALALVLVQQPTLPAPEPVAILLDIGTGGDGRPAGGDGEPAGLLASVGPPVNTPIAAINASPGSVSASATPVAATDATTIEAKTVETPLPLEPAEPPIPAAPILDSVEPRTAAVDRTPPTQAEARTKPDAVRAQPKPAPPAKPKPKPKPKQQDRQPPARLKPPATTAHRDANAPGGAAQGQTSSAAPPGAAIPSTQGGRAGREGMKGSGRGAGHGEGGTGRGPGSGGGSAGAGHYYGQLASWLNRHKRYPARARHQSEQGTVKIQFTIDRNGRLLSHRIVSSSGHGLLDQEAEAMLERASPMPAIPAALNRSRLTVTLPIHFSLR